MNYLQSSSPYNHVKNQHYLVEHNKQLKCMCELCTCGKHQCPRRAIKTDFQTSYSRQFKKFPNIAQNNIRSPYRYEERHYSPDVLKTNYQQNYQEQISFQNQQMNMSNSRLEEVGKTILGPQVPFAGISSYNEQYQPYNMIKKQDLQNPELDILTPYKSNQYIKPNTKFQGISSYKSSFVHPPQIKKPSLTPPYKKPQAQFYGISSYKDQYRPIQIMPQQSIHESAPYKNLKGVKFEGKSAYNEQFQPYKLQSADYYGSQIFNPKSQCNLDGVVIPNVNYINSKDHLHYDPELKKFY